MRQWVVDVSYQHSMKDKGQEAHIYPDLRWQAQHISGHAQWAKVEGEWADVEKEPKPGTNGKVTIGRDGPGLWVWMGSGVVGKHIPMNIFFAILMG